VEMSELAGATGVVVAGGWSKRMGRRKEAMEFGGVSLLEHVIARVGGMFSRVVVVAKEPEQLPALGVEVVKDCREGSGPLAGICGGLEALETEYAFVCACDMPFVNAGVVRVLWGHAGEGEVVIPRGELGLEPLHAFYSKRCLEPVKRALRAGKRRIVDFFHEVSVVEVGAEELSRVGDYEESFLNLNTPDEYERAVEVMRTRRARRRE